MEMPRPLHLRKHGDERPLQCLIDRQHMLVREPHASTCHRRNKMSALSAAICGPVDADSIEGDPALARLDQIIEVERGVIDSVFGERNHAVIVAAGVERVDISMVSS